MSQQFRRASRLRSRDEFTAVQHSGRRVSARFVTLLGLPNTLGRDRLGIIASRRVGGAVARTRAKRRLRELFRRREDPLQGGSAGPATLDVVAIARADLVEAPFADLHADFQIAIAKLRASSSRRP